MSARRTGLLLALVVLAGAGGGGAYVLSEREPALGPVVPGALRSGAGPVQAVQMPALTPADGADGSDEDLRAVAARGDLVVAVGTVATGGRTLPVLLRSADAGGTWQGTTTSATRVGDAPSSVAAGPRALLAVGTGPEGTVLWTSADGTAWERRAGDPAVFRQDDSVYAVQANGTGFLAVGAEALADGDTRPLLWSSPDGTTWTRRTAADLGVPVQRRGASANDVAVSGRTVVVGVGEYDPAAQETVANVAFWVSGDAGRTFARASTPLSLGAAPGDRAYLTGVAARPGGGFVAVGSGSIPGDDEDDGGYDPLVLTSPDGREWSQVDDVTLFGGDSALGDVAVTAAGAVGVGRADEDGLVLRDRGSYYERTAREVVALGAPGSQRLDGVAATTRGVVAVGTDSSRGDADALVVRGTGTGALAAVPLPVLDALAVPSAGLGAVAVTADGLVAGGSSAGDGALYASRDGRAWEVLRQAGGIADGPRPESVDALAGRPDARGVVAAGSVDEPLGARALLLSSSDGRTFGATGPSPLQRGTGVRSDRRLTGAARTDAVSVVVGRADDGRPAQSAYALWSLDGRTWASAAKAGLTGTDEAGRGMADVAAGPGRLVAVGYTGRGDDRPYGPAAWTSADGRAWSLVELPVPSGTQGEGAYLTDVAWTGRQWVALGEVDRGATDELAAWTSPDGRRWSGPSVLPVPQGRDGGAGDLVVADGRLVALGSTTPLRGNPGDQDAQVWTSPDGRAWTPFELPGRAGAGEGVQGLSAGAVHDGHLVAVGPHLTVEGVRTLLVRLPLRRLPDDPSA